MTTLLAHYQALCENGTYLHDPAQADIFATLDHLTADIVQENNKRNGLFSAFRKKRTLQGLYLYGAVGAGKSFIMDTFFRALPITAKKRVHFHEFMRTLQTSLKANEGIADPIQHIIRDFARDHSVLCFDEFVVTDIADAMLLGRVIAALMENGVCLITTSNVAPDDLYRDGLQRISFLPTIALLKKHMTAMECRSAEDYRLRHLKNAGTYHTPLNAASEHALEKSFGIMSHHTPASTEPTTLCERQVAIIKQAADCIWFDFKVLCHTPRSQHDYLALAKTYHTVFLSNIPVIGENEHNTILLFIRLIDVLYDTHTRLICSAERPPRELYPNGRFAFEFQRTCSRLIEMQSEAYVQGRR